MRAGLSARARRAGGGRLRDVTVARPALLLVGINPGLRSGALGHHFAGAGNPFWRLLAEAGITSRLLHYSEDQLLAGEGIALTNLCPRPTRSAAELTRVELERGRRTLAQKCARLRPQVVAFVGLSLYQTYFGLKASGGAGAKPETIAGARVFVVPNPSGLNASFPGFAHKLVWFVALRRFVRRVTRTKPRARSTAGRAGSTQPKRSAPDARGKVR